MGGNLFLILIVVSAIWQVIGSIAEKKAKKKQQEELARRRAEAQQRGGSPATSSPNILVQSPGGPNAPTSAGTRAEQIAARRKAQIDELRRRAAGRSGGGGGGQAPSAPAPAARSAPAVSSAPSGRAKDASMGRTSAAANPTRRPEIARDFEELNRRRDAEKAARAADSQRNDERDAMERRRREVEAKARQAKAALEEAARIRDAARSRMTSAAGGLMGSTVTGSASERLRMLAGNKQAMRDAMLLREVINAPVAFRSSPVPIDGATGLSG